MVARAQHLMHIEFARDIEAQLQAVDGTGVDEHRTLRRHISRSLEKQEPAFLIAVARELIGRAKSPRWFVYEIINKRRDALAVITVRDVEALGAGMSAWYEVDPYATYVSGPAWREGQLQTKHVIKWSASPDRWWRRAAVVSTVALNNTARGGTGDPDRTIEICSRLVDDRDDMVVKGLSWALRELAKKDKRVVRSFLHEYHERLAPRVLREVRNKLETGLKTPKAS